MQMTYIPLTRMPKEPYHPNAYLSEIKNNKLGLRARTRILNILEERSIDAKSVSTKAEMHYGVAIHHLRLLESEEIAERKGGKPYSWVLTGHGQKRLTNSM